MRIIIIITGAVLALLTSCSSEPSLQKYYVENGGKSNFAAFDIAPNFVNSDTIILSAKEKEALESVRKFNVLIYKKDSLDTGNYQKEMSTVKTLLKDEKYEELMHFGGSGRGVTISAVGEGNDVNEFVFFMHQDSNGFSVVRVLGDDMNPNNIFQMVELLQKGNLNLGQFQALEDVMTPKG